MRARLERPLEQPSVRVPLMWVLALFAAAVYGPSAAIGVYAHRTRQAFWNRAD